MFLQTFLPIPLGAADVTEVALSARILVDDARHQRFWDFVLEDEE